jgi:hypothetical protein
MLGRVRALRNWRCDTALKLTTTSGGKIITVCGLHVARGVQHEALQLTVLVPLPLHRVQQPLHVVQPLSG